MVDQQVVAELAYLAYVGVVYSAVGAVALVVEETTVPVGKVFASEWVVFPALEAAGLEIVVL